MAVGNYARLFVPIDTTLYTKYHRQLRDKGALMKAHFHFIDAHRKEWLGKYKTFNEFYKRFEVTPDMLAQLVATGKEMGVEYNEEEYQKAFLAEIADESIDAVIMGYE